MPDELRRESPLGGWHQTFERAGTAAFRLRERPFLELVSVRGNPRSAGFAGAVERTLGFAVPALPNTVSRGATHEALWIGPDEWLLQSAEPREGALERTLRGALEGEFAAVVDVSSGYTVVELAGSRARDVLQKGCPLDLHPRALRVGHCAQSHFFKAGITLRPVADAVCELIVRRSYADYVARMLLDSARDYLGETI